VTFGALVALAIPRRAFAILEADAECALGRQCNKSQRAVSGLVRARTSKVRHTTTARLPIVLGFIWLTIFHGKRSATMAARTASSIQR